MARSIKNQEFWLQKEAVPGTALETAMRRFGGIRGRWSYNTAQQLYRGQASRVVSSITKTTEFANVPIDPIQDYNSLHLVLDSILGFATPATPAGATNARQRVYNLATIGPVAPATYTGIWGDPTQAVKLVNLVFNSLGLTFNRGQLSMSTAAFARTPILGATKPTQGATHKFIPAVPISAKTYGVFLDSTWATLGTTRALAAYEGGMTIGDSFTQDWPVNDLLPSFESVVEVEEVDYTSRMVLGFDAAAIAHIGDWVAGEYKYLRFKSQGGLIEAGQNYLLQIDKCVQVQNPGEIGTAPNSPTVVLPFDYVDMEDPTTGNAMQITLINAVA